MIDTAYTLTSFPSASSTLPAQIRFKNRTTRPQPPRAARTTATPTAEHAVARSVTPERVASRGRTSYFVAGMVLIFLLIQVASWVPLEGVDLLFVRLILFAGAGICFLASGDDAVSAV